MQTKSLSSRQATQKQLPTLLRYTKCPFPPSVMPVLEQAPRQVRAESKSPYQVGGMRLRLQKLQEARKVREVSESKQGLKDGWEENADGILLWEGLPISPPNLWVFDFDYTLVGARALEERQQLNSTTTSNPNSNCWPVSTTILSFRSSTRPGAEGSDCKRVNLVAYTNSYEAGPMGCSAWTEEAWVKRRSQLVVRLKAIENTLGLSFLLFFQLPLLTSDLLTDQEVTRSKEVTLSGGNELAVLVSSSPVGLRVVALKRWAEFIDFVRMRSHWKWLGWRLYAASRDRPRAQVITRTILKLMHQFWQPSLCGSAVVVILQRNGP